jgi:hypothetical protein
MILRIMFKTPDAVENMELYDGNFDDQVYKKASEELKNWISYGELVTLEYDTDTKSLVVVEV